MAAPTLRHIAFIMDGNRRWARQHAADELYNDQAVQAIFEALIACKEHAVSYMTVYAFSLENLMQRDEGLKMHVFGALVRGCREKKELFLAHGIKVRFVGARDLFPPAVMRAVDEIEDATITQTCITLQILFCYGAQQEIVDAAARIARDVAAGGLLPKAVTSELFASYLWTAPAPFPDLIIRTGGAARLSNFLLYQAAYSELMFLECLWPEITQNVVSACIDRFLAIKRNFGA